MAAAAAGLSGAKDSNPDGMKSGLTGNIYGQDVEAAKVHTKTRIWFYSTMLRSIRYLFTLAS